MHCVQLPMLALANVYICQAAVICSCFAHHIHVCMESTSCTLVLLHSIYDDASTQIQVLKLLQVAYDLLVGADGAGSVVRSALQQTMPAHYMRRYTHKQVYSMAQVTPSNPAQIPQHTVIQLHVVKVKRPCCFWALMMKGLSMCAYGQSCCSKELCCKYVDLCSTVLQINACSRPQTL